MAQFARPDADLVNESYTRTPTDTDMYGVIDETSYDDADYVSSPTAPTSDVLAVGLSNVEDPQVDTGHIVRYRYQKNTTGGAQIDLTVQLRQGYVNEATQGTLIHSEPHTNIPNGWTAGTFTLTAPEAQNITDYTNLQLRFVANQV